MTIQIQPSEESKKKDNTQRGNKTTYSYWRTKQKVVPWGEVYGSLSLLRVKFNDFSQIGTIDKHLDITCTGCKKGYRAGWLESAAMKSNLPGFISFSSHKPDYLQTK